MTNISVEGEEIPKIEKLSRVNIKKYCQNREESQDLQKKKLSKNQWRKSKHSKNIYRQNRKIRP